MIPNRENPPAWIPGIPFFLVLLALLPGTPGQDSPPAFETTDGLMATGNLRAREKKYAQALDAWKRSYQRSFADFREMAFIYDVEASYLDRAGLRQKMLQEFQKEMPDEEIQNLQTALVCLGFFGPDLDLKKTILDILTSEVAGFYDPDTKRLYLIQEGEPERKQLWWEKILGKGGFDPDQEKMVLIHEMSHALMDQHHDLLSMQRSVENDDDMVLAMQSLVEGEAMLSMMVGAVGDGDRSILNMPPDFMNFYMNLLKPFLSFLGGPAFNRAPPILQESLYFPYFNGLTFCMSLTSGENGSWEPVNAAFSHPPLSTEQVIHPEKYGIDIPTSISFPDLADRLGPGWTEAYSNVLGELQVRILLDEMVSKPESIQASRGWDGDFYRVYRRGGGKVQGSPETLLVWASTWDSPGDAAEFASAYVRHFKKRHQEDPRRETRGDTAVRTWKGEGKISAVLSRDSDVWILDGIPEKAMGKVLEAALQIEKKPKEFRLRRVKASVEFSEKGRTGARRF